MEKQTCLKFFEVPKATSYNQTIVQWGKICSVTAKLVKKHLVFTRRVNDKYIDNDKFLKIIYWSVYFRYQLTKCLESNSNYKPGFIAQEKIEHLIFNYSCKINRLNKTWSRIQQDGEYEILLLSSCKKIVESEDLKQKSNFEQISFRDIRHLNNEVCNNGCKKYGKSQCEHYGYKNPRNCRTCLCLFFYDGKYCNKFMKPKYPNKFGIRLLKAISKKHIKY